jgi:cytochrome oxidase Cu insertion factor (SCO1/SenC/PrrC family)
MRSRITALVVLTLLSASAMLAQAKPAAKQAGPPPLKLKVGDTVPDFTLKYQDQSGELKDFKLSDYKGKKNVLLGFFIFAFTGG